MSGESAQALVRPFLKWAGNKFRIVERVRRVLPSGQRLVEPFVGSGAVFLNTDYAEYLLTDSNRDLVDLYTALQREGPDFVERCRRLFSPENNREPVYYRLRQEFNESDDPLRRAALFVYLNRHGYNGLCRYNRSGGFNVPFGRYRRPYFPEREMLLFHDRARQAVFRHMDFSATMRELRAGDVVYCDPPYVPLSRSASFTAYSSGRFGPAEQTRLAAEASEAARQGIPVLISNHDTDETRALYASARIDRFQVQRYISCNVASRDPVGELLAFYTAAEA